MEEMFDVAVIGTGPAGLSAAVTLKIRNKKVILFGSRELSEKVSKAHEIQNYLGLPAIKGQELARKFNEHIDSLGLAITQDQVTACYSMGSYFSFTTKKNQLYSAKAVIVATGVNFGKPFDGEENFLGRGVSYCATCDAPFYKGKTVAVIAQTEKEEKEASFLSEVCEKVYYIPLYKMQNVFGEKNIQVVQDQVVRIEGGMKAEKLLLKDGEINVDGIFILRDSVSPKQLIPGLELDENHIKVNRQMETNIKGLFACGDITGLPYQYIKSAGEGNVAALSAVKYLSQMKSS